MRNVRIQKIFCRAILISTLTFSSQQILAQNVEMFSFRPPVIRSDRTSSVLFEALVSGDFTSVVFEYDGIDRPMNDDGTAGDLVSGDSIYSISFPATDITGKLTDADVFRPFIGYCKILRESSPALRFNIFAEIWTDEIPLVSVEQLDSVSQVAPNLVNIIGEKPTTVTASDAQQWAQEFYRLFEDDYDFLNFIVLTGLRGNRYHISVQSTTTGLGRTLFDGTSQYGSGGRLLGVTLFPVSYFFDGAGSGYQHELGHQWINYLHSTPFEIGIPHWPLSDVASGVMGYSLPGGQGLQFPYDLVQEGENYRVAFRLGQPVFNDLELYLMGLLPSDSVESHFVFDNQDQTPQVGQLLLGPVTHVTIDDIIDSVGTREPDYSESQKQFRVATVVISESLLSVEAMSFYNYFAKRAELIEPVPFTSGFSSGTAIPFYLSTRERGELLTHIGDLPTLIQGEVSPSPSNFNLSQNHPNPFVSTTTVKFALPKESQISLNVYDMSGRLVTTLVNKRSKAGHYTVRWNAKNLPQGIYFYKFQAGNYTQSRKMVLLK